jgi:hypothetical protein
MSFTLSHGVNMPAMCFEQIASGNLPSEMSWPCAAAAYLRGLCALLAARPY